MTRTALVDSAAGGFHDGERAVQRLVGVRREAAQLEGMLAPGAISAGMAGFLGLRTFVAITARDGEGLLWTSPLVGPAGFVEVLGPTSVEVHAAPPADDPLHDPRPGTSIGLIAMDYARRRRFRLNGTLVGTGPDRLRIRVEEAFGNCPQHIPQQVVEPDVGPPAVTAGGVHAVTSGLAPEDLLTVGSSASFYLGTAHPERGADVSHRGGPAGFVHVEGPTLWWPDFPGNNLFNSLGNLQVDPEAGLLFPDFVADAALQLHGTARLDIDPGDPGSRRVVFTARHRARRRLGAHLVGR